jgi:FdhD protein
MMGTFHSRVTEYGIAAAGLDEVDRHLAVEVPVALEYDGITHAVMMATPIDLRQFAVGFSLSESIIATPSELHSYSANAAGEGWIVRMRLDPARARPMLERVRLRVSEGGCGLCGVESIEQALRRLPQVRLQFTTGRQAVAQALAGLPRWQKLGKMTGAMHAAAFCQPDGTIVRVMEDVGRHNALDKLVGALALDGIDPSQGFMLVSARCSYELVEKAVRAGCGMLVAISAPTGLAVARARESGLTLVALARSDTALILNDPAGCFA